MSNSPYWILCLFVVSLAKSFVDFAGQDFFDDSHLEFRCAQKSSQNRAGNCDPDTDHDLVEWTSRPGPGAADRGPGSARHSACVAAASEGEHAERVYAFGSGAEGNCRGAGTHSEGSAIRLRFRSFPRTFDPERHAEPAAARNEHAFFRRKIGGQLRSHSPRILRAGAFFQRA